MTELKLGRVTNAELAEWFNATKNSIEKKKKTWLQILGDYCDFEPIYGGVYINKIHKPCYVKNKNLQIVKEEFEEAWDESGLDSCKRVSEEIYNKRQEDFTVQESTVYVQTRQVRDEFYGKPMCEHGSKGCCSYVWCKKDNQTGRLVFLSPEEETIKKELLKFYFADADEKTVLVNEMIMRGELNEADAWSYYSRIINMSNNYPSFMSEFKRRTGIQLVRGTLIENELYFEE